MSGAYKAITKHLTKSDRILEIGCGYGHLAKVLIYGNYKYIRGVDSDKAIIRDVQKSLPSIYKDLFMVALLNNKEMHDCDYNTVISTEVFEYADCDLAVIKRIKKDSKVIFTIPGYKNKVYCRWFLSEREIRDRFESFLKIEDIQEIILPLDDYCKIYVVKGIKK